MDIAAEFVSSIINAFEANKRLADRAVEQVSDDKPHCPRCEHELHRRHYEARRRELDVPLDRLPDDGRREAVAQSR